MATIDRLWVRTEERDGCWIWTGATAAGYGRMWLDGRVQGVHRIAYELLVGPIPDGLDLDHLCRVRACWNPDHLEPVTRRENLARGSGRPGTANDDRCARGHAFRHPEGAPRYCPTCKADADRRRRLARAA